jgi:hypothetical protein
MYVVSYRRAILVLYLTLTLRRRPISRMRLRWFVGILFAWLLVFGAIV